VTTTRPGPLRPRPPFRGVRLPRSRPSPHLTACSSFVSPGQGDFYDENAQQFSQELRLASSSTSSLQWVAGAYYLWEDVERLEGW
jgi:hypothetical protein